MRRVRTGDVAIVLALVALGLLSAAGCAAPPAVVEHVAATTSPPLPSAPTAAASSGGASAGYPWLTPWHQTPYLGPPRFTLTPSPTPTPVPTPTPPAPLDGRLETLLYVRPVEGAMALMSLQVTASGRVPDPPQDITPPQYRYPVAPNAGPGSGSIVALHPSPAGRDVAVVRVVDGAPRIDVLDTLDWHSESMLPEASPMSPIQDARFLAWSMDGRQVLLAVTPAGPEGRHELWLVDAHDHDYRVLHAFPPDRVLGLDRLRASFAPGGAVVAVAVEAPVDGGFSRGEVWLFAIDGGEPTRVAEALGDHLPLEWLGWSPRGDALALAVQRDPGDKDVLHCDLWLVRLDGSSPRHLSDALVAPHLAPVWEPDGRGITCVRGIYNLYRVDVETRAMERLADHAYSGRVLAAHRTGAGNLLYATQEHHAYDDDLVVWRRAAEPDSGPPREVLRAADTTLAGGYRYALLIAWLPAEREGQENVP